jgi:hypothetical protein
MAVQTINNGTFDNDGSAEKIRLAFEKAKDMFTEIYAAIPLDAGLSGQTGKFLRVNGAGDGYELVNLTGGGDLLAANNLSELASASTSRTNLGLKTAAVADLIDEDTMSSDSATKLPSQQSVKAYVDGKIVAYAAGAGITIQTTSPYSASAPGIIADDVGEFLANASFAASTRILTLTMESGGTITVDLSAHTVLLIDGYEVIKGSGKNNMTTIELTDKIKGWLSATRYINGIVNTIPYATEGNIDFVQDETI